MVESVVWLRQKGAEAKQVPLGHWSLSKSSDASLCVALWCLAWWQRSHWAEVAGVSEGTVGMLPVWSDLRPALVSQASLPRDQRLCPRNRLSCQLSSGRPRASGRVGAQRGPPKTKAAPLYVWLQLYVYTTVPRSTLPCWKKLLKPGFEIAGSWLTSSDQLPAWRSLSSSSYLLKQAQTSYQH